MKSLRPQIKLACFLAATALTASIFAVDPPPDGGYPGNNTAEGEDALFSLTTGTSNTAMGFEALFSVTSGGYNTAVGQEALADNTGSFNTAIGFNALSANTTAAFNTAMGAQALLRNTTGSFNTAIGADALFNNTTGRYNTAVGYDALVYNTTGSDNTAVGMNTMFYNTIGAENTAIGESALHQNTIGNSNTAIGNRALYTNVNGNSNTAIGNQALYGNSGNSNTAVGYQALLRNVNGNYNTASGQGALYGNTSGTNNTADGQNALHNNTTGRNNIAIGSNAGFNLTTGSNNIEVGNPGVAGESNTIRIGRQGTQTATFIAGISGATVPTGVAVIVDSSGHLGTTTSSARFKEAIKPMDKASEAILALKPVTFYYKQIDTAGIQQFGLVAEEVEKVNPNLVARDAEGKAYTVRYEAINAMLLNEFLKEHRTVQEQKETIAQLKQDFAEQQKQIEALTAGLQKVSAQIELSKFATGRIRLGRPAPRVADNQ